MQELEKLLLYATFRMKLLGYETMERAQSWKQQSRKLQLRA